MTESPAYSTETELSELTAFNLLYRLHVSALVNYAERFVDDGTARDLVHDVFVRIWTARRFRMPETEIRRYLFRCVLNACRDHVRHQQVENNFLSKTIAQLKLHELEYHEAHWEHAPDERQLRAVYLEIDKLPDRCREIFRRTYLDGCKSRDIAAELGISQRTVEAQLYKALKQEKEYHVVALARNKEEALTGILTLGGWLVLGRQIF